MGSANQEARPSHAGTEYSTAMASFAFFYCLFASIPAENKV